MGQGEREGEGKDGGKAGDNRRDEGAGIFGDCRILEDSVRTEGRMGVGTSQHCASQGRGRYPSDRGLIRAYPRRVDVRVDPSFQQLHLQLQPLLLSTFLESAPTAFSPSSVSSFPQSSQISSGDVSMTLCSLTTSLTETLAKAILTHTTQSSTISDVRTSVSDYVRRMAPYFPFRDSLAAVTPAGVSPAFSLSSSYAKLSILLTPRIPYLSYPRETRRELGWERRLRAVEKAWTIMRQQRDGAKGKGKAGGADDWALEEVAEWVIQLLVSRP